MSKRDLYVEDAYDDIECSEYEIRKYFPDEDMENLIDEEEEDDDEEEEDLEEIEDLIEGDQTNLANDVFDDIEDDKHVKKNKTKKKDLKRNCQEDEVLNLYTQNIIVENGNESRIRYTRLAQLAKTGTEQQKRDAREEACLYMKGLVRNFISTKYRNYIERDPSYGEELEQEAYLNIIKELPNYDPSKGQPSTFFYYHILSAMSSTTNTMKHSISSSDAALQRKIKRIRAEYEKIGKKPEIGDYIIETNETMSKIRSVLRMMDMDMNTHLEAIEEFDQIIPGDVSKNSAFDSPENIIIKKIMTEEIVKRMYELFTNEEIEIFFRHEIDGESIPSIVKSTDGNEADDKVRRTIEKIRHAIAYDTEIRKLCSSYIKENMTERSSVTILPISGTDENMDLLETIAF